MKAPLDRAKLAKVLARLESPHDGERAAAGLIAAQMVREAGVNWAALLSPPMPQPHARRVTAPRPSPRPAFIYATPRELRRTMQLLRQWKWLTQGEREFLNHADERLYREPHIGLGEVALYTLGTLWSRFISGAAGAEEVRR